jgi:3-dehydroquinate dehydratase-2
MSGTGPGKATGAGTGAGRALRVLVLNGPNLDLLGTREPTIYGRETLGEINATIAARAVELDVAVAFFQSNHEGALIDRLHRRDFDAAIVNAAGLTHTSVSLRDALLAVERPFVEVHLSDPATASHSGGSTSLRTSRSPASWAFTPAATRSRSKSWRGAGPRA